MVLVELLDSPGEAGSRPRGLDKVPGADAGNQKVAHRAVRRLGKVNGHGKPDLAGQGRQLLDARDLCEGELAIAADRRRPDEPPLLQVAEMVLGDARIEVANVPDAE